MKVQHDKVSISAYVFSELPFFIGSQQRRGLVHFGAFSPEQQTLDFVVCLLLHVGAHGGICLSLGAVPERSFYREAEARSWAISCPISPGI